jgi:hypothetical protein
LKRGGEKGVFVGRVTKERDFIFLSKKKVSEIIFFRSRKLVFWGFDRFPRNRYKSFDEYRKNDNLGKEQRGCGRDVVVCEKGKKEKKGRKGRHSFDFLGKRKRQKKEKTGKGKDEVPTYFQAVETFITLEI